MVSSSSAPSARASRVQGEAHASAQRQVWPDNRRPTSFPTTAHLAPRCADVPLDILSIRGAIIGGSTQSVYSATPSSSTSRAFEPSGFDASVRWTRRPGSVRQIEVVSVSPGKTGEVNRAPIAVTFVASPPPRPLTSARPATP